MIFFTKSFQPSSSLVLVINFFQKSFLCVKLLSVVGLRPRLCTYCLPFVPFPPTFLTNSKPFLTYKYVTVMHKFGNSTYCQGQIFYFLKSSTSSRLLTPESWNSLNFKACLKTYTLFVCLFFCEEFILPLENFSLIWRRHLCRWKATKFDLSSALMACEGSLRCHIHCDTGLPFIIVISEDPWHSHLFPSFWQWSCHYLFLRLRSVATGDRTPISCMRGERSTSHLLNYEDLFTQGRSWVCCLWGSCGLKDELKLISIKPSSNELFSLKL